MHSLPTSYIPHFLPHSDSLKSADTKSKKRYALEIALKNEQFLLVATSDRDKDEWISA